MDVWIGSKSSSGREKEEGGRREGEMQFAKCSVTYIPNGYFIKRYAMQRR